MGVCGAGAVARAWAGCSACASAVAVVVDRGPHGVWVVLCEADEGAWDGVVAGDVGVCEAVGGGRDGGGRGGRCGGGTGAPVDGQGRGEERVDVAGAFALHLFVGGDGGAELRGGRVDCREGEDVQQE